MNIQEKAKAYDEALKRAKELLEIGLKDTRDKRVVLSFFPELKEKENEDEKIKKSFIRLVKAFNGVNFPTPEGFERKDMLAWLEKQGNKPHGKSALEAAKEEKVDNTNKVEPKFKIEKGKWYVCIKDLLDNYANKAFNKGDTYLSTQDGSLIPSNSNIPFEVVCPDTYFRDWTIADAKDGDVLACNEEILLFKSYSVQGRISLYCWYNGQTNNFHSKEVVDTSLTKRNKICPATKEQRDILFQKMKETGYEWDANKKKLNKTGEKPLLSDFFKAEYERGKADAQKPVEWSEEDERRMNNLCHFLEEYGNQYYGHLTLQDTISWLKSLRHQIIIWHDSSEMPKEKKVCLIRYSANDGASTNNFEVVIAEPLTRRFVTRSYPHKTGYQHTIHGETTIKVDDYQDRREKIPFSDIDEWAYIDDLLNINL